MVAGQVGVRLRELREARGLSLRGMASASGLSVNAISRIERGESSPTVASLARLAEALDRPIGAFFEENKPAPAAILVPRDRRLRAEGQGVVLETLAAGLPEQCFDPYLLTLEPGACDPSGPVEHSGQEFLLCLQGSVTCRVGDETHRLATGDSLLFRAEHPHLFRNDNQGFATLILVHEPDRHASSGRSPHLEF